MKYDDARRMPPARHGANPLLRGIVLLIALGEIAAVAYLWYTLYLDDTTSWLVMVFPEIDSLRLVLSLPLGIGGGAALLLAIADRWLWMALAAALAAPVVALVKLFGSGFAMS